MGTKVVIVEKKENGELVVMDERDWTPEMIHLLDHVNYVLVDDKEYEMIEGRLNVNNASLEIMVIASNKQE